MQIEFESIYKLGIKVMQLELMQIGFEGYANRVC